MPTFLQRGIGFAESLRRKYAGGGRVEWNVVEGPTVLKGKDANAITCFVWWLTTVCALNPFKGMEIVISERWQKPL